MEYKYDYLVFIGRFQPWHEGHEDVLKTALKLSRNVIVMVGSSNRHISVKNPWTYEQREEMILGSSHFTSIEQELIVQPLNDYPNDTAWVMAVENNYKSATKHRALKPLKVGLIGYDKDSTSYYMKMFPTWEVEQIKVQYGTINSTEIREQYFQRAPVISEFIPNHARNYLKRFALLPEFKWLLDEFEYHRDYRRMWANSPFPPFFVTVDPIVIQSGNILLVTRKESPYKGALALPGGFVKEKETLVTAVIRELREETQISDDKGELPPAMLKSFITESKVFDDPERSQRGRSITHAYLFDLPKKGSLYKVVGSDDAEKAEWYSLASLKTPDFMEDHAFIIQGMLGIEF